MDVEFTETVWKIAENLKTVPAFMLNIISPLTKQLLSRVSVANLWSLSHQLSLAGECAESEVKLY